MLLCGVSRSKGLDPHDKTKRPNQKPLPDRPGDWTGQTALTETSQEALTEPVQSLWTSGPKPLDLRSKRS